MSDYFTHQTAGYVYTSVFFGGWLMNNDPENYDTRSLLYQYKTQGLITLFEEEISNTNADVFLTKGYGYLRFTSLTHSNEQIVSGAVLTTSIVNPTKLLNIDYNTPPVKVSLT